ADWPADRPAELAPPGRNFFDHGPPSRYPPYLLVSACCSVPAFAVPFQPGCEDSRCRAEGKMGVGRLDIAFGGRIVKSNRLSGCVGWAAGGATALAVGSSARAAFV